MTDCMFCIMVVTGVLGLGGGAKALVMLGFAIAGIGPFKVDREKMALELTSELVGSTICPRCGQIVEVRQNRVQRHTTAANKPCSGWRLEV